MPDLFTCRCGQRLAVSPESRGKQVRCPRCRQALLIPAAAVAPLPAVPRRSRRLGYAAAALVLLLGTGGGVFLYQHNRAADTPPPQEAQKEDAPPEPKDTPRKRQGPPKIPSQPPATANEANVLARINAARREAGLAAVILDAALSRSCRSQAKAGAADRGALLLPGDPLDAVAVALASCFRRPLLLAPDLERIGIGWTQGSSEKRVSVFAFARVAPPRQGPALYPVEGQVDVPLSFPGNEVPDPVPQAKGRAAGFPITVTFPQGSRIREATGRLSDGAGKEVAAWFSSPQQPANPDFRPEQGTTLCLIARDLLRPNTTYTVKMSAQVGGDAWARTWRFTTTTPERQTAGMTGRVLARLNALRRTAGLAALPLDDKLTKACQAHAAYLALNAERADRPDFNSNDEDPRLPGFSKEGKKAAAEAQVFSAPANPEAMADSWLASFQGRLVVLDFDAEAVGLGCARGPGKWQAVVLPKLPEFSRRREPLLYPADKQKDVPTYYDGGETPDPIPESKDRLAGFPVTATFPENMAVTDVRAEFSRNGTAVPFWLSTPQKPVAPDAQRNTVCLIARRPLQGDSVYTVRLRAKVNRKAWERVWTFRTEQGRPEDQRGMILATLARINVHRRRAGLTPVVLDSGLSPACFAHARYLLLNSHDPSTHGLGMHEENPKLPGYTAEGQRTGKRSVVASGMPPPSAVADWMATFYHRIPFLEPRLGRVGIGFVRGGPQGWVTVIDVSAGVGLESVLLFPADGQKDVPSAWQPTAADRKALPDAAGRKVGYPITLTFPAGKKVRQVEALLTAEGKEVASWLLTAERFETVPSNSVCVLPRQPLRAGTTYTVRATARSDGKAWEQTWSFTTAPSR